MGKKSSWSRVRLLQYFYYTFTQLFTFTECDPWHLKHLSSSVHQSMWAMTEKFSVHEHLFIPQKIIIIDVKCDFWGHHRALWPSIVPQSTIIVFKCMPDHTSFSCCSSRCNSHISARLGKEMPCLVACSWAACDHYDSAHMFNSELPVTHDWTSGQNGTVTACAVCLYNEEWQDNIPDKI